VEKDKEEDVDSDDLKDDEKSSKASRKLEKTRSFSLFAWRKGNKEDKDKS